MPVVKLRPQDGRASYGPGDSITFAVSGAPTDMVLPGRTRVCGFMYVSPTGVAKMFNPSTGANSIISSVLVKSSGPAGQLQYIIDFDRYAALAGAVVRPEDAAIESCAGQGDWRGGSGAVQRGVLDWHSAAAPAGSPYTELGPVPLCLELPFRMGLQGNLFDQPLPFARLGTLEITLTLNSPAACLIQDGGTDATYALLSPVLYYETAAATPALIKQPIAYRTVMSHRLAVESGEATLSLPPGQVAQAVAVSFLLQSHANTLTYDGQILACPPSLERVEFALSGEGLTRWELEISDPYGAPAISGFYEALAAGGMIPSGSVDSLVARASSATMRARQANAGANGVTAPLGEGTANAYYIPDAYGLGARIPAGKANAPWAGTAISVRIRSGATSGAGAFFAWLTVFTTAEA